MATASDDCPAFPVPMVPHDSQGGFTEVRWQGMSIRAYFAGQALAGLNANENSWAMKDDDIIDCALRHADLLIERLGSP